MADLDKNNKPEEIKESNNKKTSGTALSMALGIAMGIPLGMLFDNVALGIAMGVAIGFALQAGKNKKNDNK